METKLLIKKCEEIVDSVIAKEYREEAKEVIRLTTNEHRKDLIKYFKLDQGNICCLVIDTAKRDLLKNGTVFENKGNSFGNPLL